MKKLSSKFTKNRHNFEQLCRSAHVAIYLVHVNGRQKSFEVIVIRVANRKPVKGSAGIEWIACEPYECYPSSDAWGVCGFTFTSEEEARKKYDRLNDPEFKLPAPALYPIRPRARYGKAQHVL